MDKRVKALWVKALRSGKYKQGRGWLRTNYGNYCCLGVLTICYNKAMKATSPLNNVTGLAGEVMRWAGIYETDPFIGDLRATRRNDVLRESFKTIADAIEKFL